MPFRYGSPVELRHLRYFVAVAETLSFSGAATRLRVAQPALSRQIRDLEDELGTRLFERGSRGVRLTSAGQVFVAEARAVLDRTRQATDAVRAAGRGECGELHVGYAPSPTVELLPRALDAFQQTAPQVAVRLHDLSSAEMLAGLRQRTLGLALLVDPGPERLGTLRFEELARYPFRVAVGPRHPLARTRGGVSLGRLVELPLHVYGRTDYPEYHGMLAGLFVPLGREPLIAGEHDSVNSLIAAVETGRGAALVPACLACLAGPRLKLLALRPAPVPLSVGAAFDPTQLDPAAARFLDRLRALAGKAREENRERQRQRHPDAGHA